MQASPPAQCGGTVTSRLTTPVALAIVKNRMWIVIVCSPTEIACFSFFFSNDSYLGKWSGWDLLGMLLLLLHKKVGDC